MQLLIPLRAIPNQTVQVGLSSQAVSLNVYQLPYGLFVDVLSGNAYVAAGQIAQNMNRIIRGAYIGFTGDFCFVDTEGLTDPVYTGLGARYQLVYDDTGFAAFLR